MNEPMPRLISRLDAAVRDATEPVARACLRAERAGARARQGQPEEAAAEIAALRGEFASHPDVEVSVWLGIAEGWLAHYTNLSDSASDKMKRALALSTAAKLPALQALSAAWLAHFSYFRIDAAATAKYLEISFSAAAQKQHSARARACLVAASSFHFAERFELAQPWYAKAREHATAEGDDATLSALIHNMGWFRATHAMKADIFGGDSLVLAQHALAIYESTHNQDRRIGTTPLEGLACMLRATIACVQRDYAQAISLYEASLPQAESQGLSYMKPCVLANLAWCQMKLGDSAGACVRADSAADCLSLTTYPEDRMLANGRLSQVFVGLGDSGRGDRFLRMACSDMKEQSRLQASFIEALQAAALG